MQATSSPGEKMRPDAAVIDVVEGFAVLRTLFPRVRDLSNKGYIFLRDHRILKWLLLMLATLMSFQSYFVRQLLAALFFFTILYAILAALVVLYLLFDYALSFGILWVESFGYSFHRFLQNRIASSSRVLRSSHRRASDGDQRSGRALTSAVTILLPRSLLGTSLALESIRQVGSSSCSELHCGAGGKARGDGK